MQNFRFRKSPNYEATITWAESFSWSGGSAAAPFHPTCFFESVRDGEWFLERDGYPAVLFELMLDGELEYEVDGRKFLSRAGELFLTPAGRKTVVRSTKSGHCHRLGLEMGGALLSNLLDSMGIRLPFNLKLCDPAGMEALLRRLYDYVKRRRDSETGDVIGLCAKLLACVSMEIGSAGIPHIPEHFQKLLDWIHSHPERNFTLKELCCFCGENSSALNRFFRMRFNRTPMAYVISSKMMQAQSMLRRGDFSVKEVSANLGFANPFYFSRVFTKTFGIPPSRIGAE